VTAISRTFPDARIAAAAVQDLCDAGFVLDDIDVVSLQGAVGVTVRATDDRDDLAAEVMDRHTAAVQAPTPPAPDPVDTGPTTDDVRREREAVWGSAEGGGESSAARFGAEMAANPRYGDADWTIVEPEARRQWLERGRGAWDAVRDEVREAWEGTRGPRAA
jgi:hypothetical protein